MNVQTYMKLNKVNLQSRFVLSLIDELGGRGQFTGTNRELSDITGLSVKRIESLIKTLEDEGYITRSIEYKEYSKEIDYRVIKTITKGF